MDRSREAESAPDVREAAATKWLRRDEKRALLHTRADGTKGSDVPERHYIDPTFLPTPACYMLYGWLLSHQFQVDAGVYERARLLPDPLDESLPTP